MRYDFVCKKHDPSIIFEIERHMMDSGDVLCPLCSSVCSRFFEIPAVIMPGGGRSLRFPNKRSNKEYQTYKRWEENGGEPDDPLRNDFLLARGDL